MDASGRTTHRKLNGNDSLLSVPHMTRCGTRHPIRTRPESLVYWACARATSASSCYLTRYLHPSYNPSTPSPTLHSYTITTTTTTANNGDNTSGSPITTTITATMPRNRKRTSSSAASQVPRSKAGCWTCRIRRKRCDEQMDETGHCQACKRLDIECLGWGSRRPEWCRVRASISFDLFPGQARSTCYLTSSFATLFYQ
jgi:hypothetical protein